MLSFGLSKRDRLSFALSKRKKLSFDLSKCNRLSFGLSKRNSLRVIPLQEGHEGAGSFTSWGDAVELISAQVANV